MTRIFAFLLALLTPVPALSLSCIAPTVEHSYAQFDAADEHYLVVHGRLTFDTTLLPTGMLPDRKPPRMTKIKGELKGASLSTKGFKLPFDRDVVLEVSCLGPWCGQANSGQTVLAFVRKEDDQLTIAVTPCGGAVFASPKPKMLRKVRQCAVANACKAIHE